VIYIGRTVHASNLFILHGRNFVHPGCRFGSYRRWFVFARPMGHEKIASSLTQLCELRVTGSIPQNEPDLLLYFGRRKM